MDMFKKHMCSLYLNISLCCIKRNKKFFGGIQLVITGDFLQLLPVYNNNIYNDSDTRLIIESETFLKNFNSKNTIFLNVYLYFYFLKYY